MTTPVYTCVSGNSKSYFHSNQIGSLLPILCSEIIPSDKKTPERQPTLNVLALIHDSLERIREIYESSSKKINEEMGALQLETGQEKIDSGMKLSLYFEANFKQITTLFLKGLKLKLLPPQLQILSNLSNLDVSHNQLEYLLPELKNLPLTRLDISGNEELQPKLPEWLKREGLELIAEGMNIDYIFNLVQIG